MLQPNDAAIDRQNPTLSSPFRSYLLIENPSKRNNLGPFLRCAAAFGVETIVFVGYAKCSSHGSHGADKHVKTIAFTSFSHAIDFLRKPVEAGGCGVKSIIGCLGPNDGEGAFNSDCTVVENDSNLVLLDTLNHNDTHLTKYPPSYPVHLRPFQDGNVCFSLCKYRSGLPKHQASYCDFFVHVPIRPTVSNRDEDTSIGLLDAQTSLSIILHHWTAWANYSVRKFTGQKFEVTTIQRGFKSDDDNHGVEKRNQRKWAKISQIEESDDTLSAECWTYIFGEDHL